MESCSAPLQVLPQSNYTDASQLDISSRGKYSIPIKNMEILEKRACNLVAINSHANLFLSATYQCLQ